MPKLREEHRSCESWTAHPSGCAVHTPRRRLAEYSRWPCSRRRGLAHSTSACASMRAGRRSKPRDYVRWARDEMTEADRDLEDRAVIDAFIHEHRNWDDRIEVRRLALTWDEVQQYSLPPNPAKSTDARYRKYCPSRSQRFGDTQRGWWTTRSSSLPKVPCQRDARSAVAAQGGPAILERVPERGVLWPRDSPAGPRSRLAGRGGDRSVDVATSLALGLAVHSAMLPSHPDTRRPCRSPNHDPLEPDKLGRRAARGPPAD